MALAPVAVALAAALVVPAQAAARRTIGTPYIQAHRGGAVVNGVPTYPENAMPAFRHSAAKGFVLELDVKLTKDRVPVVMHDATLDRTTDCIGRVDAETLAQLRRCRVDFLGSEGNSIHLGPHDPRRARVPTLRGVLRLVKRTGVGASIEIKNIPTDPDYDSTDAFARTVSEAIRRSRVARSQLIIQSFWPPNLDVAKGVLPDVELSFLTLGHDAGGASFAQSHGYAWLSPQWPVDPASIAQAHSLGLRIVPYTIDSAPELAAAAAAGVDAVITNDPTRARRVFHRVEPAAPSIPSPPGRRRCRAARAPLDAPPVKALDPAPGAPRVFAIQVEQEARTVVSYRSFRAKVECMVRRYVVPHLARHRPNVVAFTEDVGLLTLGTGSRGAAGRAIIEHPDSVAACSGQPPPCAAASALLDIISAYAPQVAAYVGRFPQLGALARGFVAPTDTLARGWMQTFSDLARRYGIYIVGSSTQAPLRESRDPSEIDAFHDPDHPRPDSVYVATEPNVHNEVFMWGPHDVRREGPLPLRNVVARNLKVPVTSLESLLQVSSGPSRGPDAKANLRPYRLPHTRARIGFATSAPAFQFGYDFGRPPPDSRPCADVSVTYMRCLSHLGANVVIQGEANSGRWVADADSGAWQPLEWMGSSWRDAVDPGVRIDYNVTPFLVGNLGDIVFDGQSSIAQRPPASGRGCNYVGNRRFQPNPPEADPARFRGYAGRKRQLIALARWVRPGGPRDELRAMGDRLAPGSGDPLENHYLETALIADLPFPPDPSRPACARGEPVDVRAAR